MVRSYTILAAILLTAPLLSGQEGRPGATPAPVLVLNVNASGEVRVPGRKAPLRTEKEVQAFLKAEAQKARPDPTKELRTTVLLNTHPEARYNAVYRLLEECRAAGFQGLRLRAAGE